MKQIKDIALVLAFIIPGLAIMYVDITRVKEPVSVEYFKQGQILLPDMVCSDTLIVVDAIGLNKAFAPIEQGISGNDYGDMQYDSLFHQYCKIK